MKLMKVPLNSIDLDDEVRRFASQGEAEENVEGLAESILTVGLIHPVVVRETGGGRYRLVVGERRFHAYRLLQQAQPDKFSEIDAVVIDRDSEIGELLKKIDENREREDPPLSLYLKLVERLEEATKKPASASISRIFGGGDEDVLASVSEELLLRARKVLSEMKASKTESVVTGIDSDGEEEEQLYLSDTTAPIPGDVDDAAGPVDTDAGSALKEEEYSEDRWYGLSPKVTDILLGDPEGKGARACDLLVELMQRLPYHRQEELVDLWKSRPCWGDDASRVNVLHMVTPEVILQTFRVNRSWIGKYGRNLTQMSEEDLLALLNTVLERTYEPFREWRYQRHLSTIAEVCRDVYEDASTYPHETVAFFMGAMAVCAGRLAESLEALILEDVFVDRNLLERVRNLFGEMQVFAEEFQSTAAEIKKMFGFGNVRTFERISDLFAGIAGTSDSAGRAVQKIREHLNRVVEEGTSYCITPLGALKRVLLPLKGSEIASEIRTLLETPEVVDALGQKEISMLKKAIQRIQEQKESQVVTSN